VTAYRLLVSSVWHMLVFTRMNLLLLLLRWWNWTTC